MKVCTVQPTIPNTGMGFFVAEGIPRDKSLPIAQRICQEHSDNRLAGPMRRMKLLEAAKWFLNVEWGMTKSAAGNFGR